MKVLSFEFFFIQMATVYSLSYDLIPCFQLNFLKDVGFLTQDEHFLVHENRTTGSQSNSIEKIAWKQAIFVRSKDVFVRPVLRLAANSLAKENVLIKTPRYEKQLHSSRYCKTTGYECFVFLKPIDAFPFSIKIPAK